MRISRKSWTEFKNALAKINEKAANEMAAWLERNGGYDAIDRELVLDMAYAIATKYGEASSTLSALYYDAIADLEKALVPPAEVAETASYSTVAKSVQGAAKTSTDSKYLGGVVGRLSKQAGQDTTLQNAKRDNAQVMWMTVGDTCAYCLSLSAMGWVNASREMIEGGHAKHIHANCDCFYAVKFNSNTVYDGYSSEDNYKKIYQLAVNQGVINDGDKLPVERLLDKNILNATRREAYDINSKEINAQKRSAYAKRMERESSEAEEIDV